MGSCDFISSTEGARKCLEDISFPASKQDILSHLENSSGPEAAIVAANQIPEKVYESLNELLDYLGTKEHVIQFEIPKPLTLEHEKLHVALKGALEIGGDVGTAARKVADLLHPHFCEGGRVRNASTELAADSIRGQCNTGYGGYNSVGGQIEG